MGKCTVCGAEAGVGFSVCDSCAKNSALATGSPGFAGGTAPSVKNTAPSVKKMNRFILVLCACLILWALMAGPENFAERYFACGIIQGCDGPRSSIAYLLEPLLGYDFGITVAHMLDITPFVLTVGLLVIAWITKRHEGESEDTEEALTALNRCDGCKTTFRNFDYLIKVDGKGFLCEKCRSAPETPQPEG